MNLLQRLFARVDPSFESESREWVVECTKCGRQRSLWEAGGVRYKAYGTKFTLGRCKNCERLRPLKIHRPR